MAVLNFMMDSGFVPAQIEASVFSLIHAVTSPDLNSPSAGFISLLLNVSLVIILKGQGTEELRKHTCTDTHTHSLLMATLIAGSTLK